MKVLTIKEPWATLIIEGYKKYEFRTWKTNYRGKILIHAGKTFDRDNLFKFDSYNLDYEKGAIIGEADLVDCILVDEKFDKKLRLEDDVVYFNDHVNNYAWKLSNVKKYKEVIYINGKLGLWNFNKND